MAKNPREHAGKYKECCTCGLQTICLKHEGAQHFQCKECNRVLVSYSKSPKARQEFMTFQRVDGLDFKCPFSEADICPCINTVKVPK